MARGKKKESALTPEEKLAQALVPDWEQPYKVPRNWCWVRLGSLGYTNIGLTYKPANISATGTIVLRSSNIQNGQMDYSDIVSVEMDIPESKMSKKGDILICARNGSKALVGKTAIIDRDGMSYGAFMAIFRSPYNSLIYHYLNSHYFRDIIDHDVGTTTINQITQSLIKELPFPLPPFAEQQRIVDRIEYLFSKLDEAKEKAQSVLDSFETRKAAILHKAFTGELTANWRNVHGVRMGSWKEQTIVDLCSLIVDCPHSTPAWTEAGRVCLRTTNIKDGHLDFSEVRYVSQETFDHRNQRAIPQAGDVLLTREGSIGDVGVIPDGWEICLGQRMMLLRPDGCEANFLVYFFRNPKIIADIKSETIGSTAPRMNIKDLKKLQMRCPAKEEQKEIVRILDSLFAKEQQAREAAEAVLEKIDLLKKSILARAFRGELGTNDPTEEIALELLKKVLDLPTEPKAPVKRTFIPKDLGNQIKTELERKIIKLYIQGDTDVVTISQMMRVSSKKFELMEALRNLQQRGVLAKENDAYKLLR